MLGLFWISLLAILLYVFMRRKPATSLPSDEQNVERDQMWLDYLGSFLEVAKTDKEKRLLTMLIEGKTAADFVGAPLPKKNTKLTPAQIAEAEAAPATQPVMAAPAYTPVVSKKAQPIDNTILLLYFGAFLLVASVGLFVSIGGLGGLARTIIVGIAASVLYGGGMWLYGASKKLAQAGISFVGTGMMIAPLTGVAWYNLVSHQTNAGLIWLVTSLVCIGLYIHAYNRIKNGFVSYLLIGSFVSSIESAVLTINLPAYGYAWGLIAAGLLLMISNRLNVQSKNLSEASDTSSNLLIPLSIVGSIVLLPQFGSIQLAITLFLSGIYYSLLASWHSGQRRMFSSAAQVSFIAALASMVYNQQQTLASISITLTVIVALYCLIIFSARRELSENHELVRIAGFSALIGSMLSLGNAWVLVVSLGAAAVLGVIVWQKFQSQNALQVAGLLLIALPFVIGQYALQIPLDSWNQLLFCLISAAVLGVLAGATTQYRGLKQYYNSASILYIIAAVLVLIPAGALGYGVLSSVVAAMMASFVLLRYLSKDSNWLLNSALIIFVPLAYALVAYGSADVCFSAAVFAALTWTISLSLVTRESLTRWLAVICILIAPFAIGGGGLGIHWQNAGYAGGYLLAMASCILARTVARGKLLVSAKVPILSYSKEASQAYVTGYILAGILAVLFSLSDANSRIVTTLVLSSIAAAITIIAKIERNNQVLAILPLVLQGVLFSGLRPDVDSAAAIGIAAIVSSFAAAAVYACVSILVSDENAAVIKTTRLVSVCTAYIGPGLVLTQAHPSMLLPVSLFLAGLITFDYNRSSAQGNKELSLAVCIASFHWLLLLAGITNIHVHTHLLALFLAGFALWRSALNDTKTSQSYVQALFFTVTIPLALQSLSGESGGTYGLLLIAEQVFFMTAGVIFGQRFLLRWGLWTALAAILFQLRGLGWAFLSLLAIIIIGVAVYRLQKHPPDDK